MKILMYFITYRYQCQRNSPPAELRVIFLLNVINNPYWTEVIWSLPPIVTDDKEICIIEFMLIQHGS